MSRRIPRAAPTLAFDVEAPLHFSRNWSKPLRIHEHGVVLLAAGGHGPAAELIAFDSNDGTRRWRREESADGWLTPPCRLGEEILTLLRGDDGVTEIHIAPDGTVASRHELDASDVHPPHPINGTDYLLLERSRTETPFSTSLRRRGRAIWRAAESLELATPEWCVTRSRLGYRVRRLPSPSIAYSQATGVSQGFVSGMAISTGVIIALERPADASRPDVVAREIETGARRWSFRPEDAVYDVEADSAVVVQTLRSGEGSAEILHLFVLSLADGTQIASARIPERSYVVALDSTHILMSDGRTLVCRVLAEPEAIAWELALPTHRSMAVYEDAIYLSGGGRLFGYR